MLVFCIYTHFLLPLASTCTSLYSDILFSQFFLPGSEHICFQVFVGARLHVTGGALRGGRGVEGEAAIAGKL